MRFIAMDLETANLRMSSICQIGVVTFEDGKEVAAEMRLVDPQDYFDPGRGPRPLGLEGGRAYAPF